MTVTVTTTKDGPYSGDGVNTSFPFSFKAPNDSDVVVAHTDVNGLETVLLVSEYILVTNADQDASPGGTVTYPTDTEIYPELQTGEKLTVYRQSPLTQTTDIVNGTSFLPEVVELALDRYTLLAQELKEEFDRCVKVDISSGVTAEEYLDSIATAAGAAGTAAAAVHASNASDSSDHAAEWANTVEDTLISVAAGGDQVDDYSALHHANKSAASASNASTSESNASTSASNASTSESNASTSASNASTSESNAASSANSVLGKQTIWIPAQAMIPTVTAGAGFPQNVETTAGRPDMIVMDFDPTASKASQFQVAFPKQWDENTVSAQFFWSGSNTDTGNVMWTIQGVAVSDSGLIDAAYGGPETVTDAFSGTLKDLMISSESSAVTIAGTPAEGDMCFFKITRDADDVGDTYTGDARLLGIKLHFTNNTGNDA